MKIGRLVGQSISHNVFGLCVRAGLLARMFKVSTAPRLTQNRCYKLAADYQPRNLILKTKQKK